MGTTSISVSDAENFAKQLRELIPRDLIDKYYKQKPQGLEAGPDTMDAAGWLEAIVGDRGNAVPAHLEYLAELFEGLADAVETIAETLTGADADNASTLYALQMWVDDVNATTAMRLPPGLKTNYDSNDTGGNPYLGWVVGADGRHEGDPDKIDVHLGRENRPNEALFDDLFRVYLEAGWTSTLPWFSSAEVKSTDPES
jgi:hypothetical protein